MARETFLFRADTTNAIVAGRQYGIDGSWTGYTSPACLYNKKGSGKVIRVRKVDISPVGITDISGNSLQANHNLQWITSHGDGDATYNVTKMDSTSATFPATIEIKTNVHSVTASTAIFRTGNYTYWSPFFFTVYPPNRNFINRWNDATTAEYQQLTIKNGEGLGITGGSYTTNTYQYPMTVIMTVRLSDTGATYFIRGETRVFTPYIFTILNNGYSAGDIQVLSIEYAQEKPSSDAVTPTGNPQDHNQEIIFIDNAQINAQGSAVTPLKMDSTSSLNANILCLKDATVVPKGQYGGSYTRTITVGNALMKVKTAWTEQRDPLIKRTKANTLVSSVHEDTDIILREGMGIAYVPSTYDSQFGAFYVDFLFTQENTEANAVYPVVGDVDLSVTYGPTGADYTGTLEQPATTDVLSGVQYGAGGTEFTGTATGGGGGNVFIINE
jgi:hypothetical protein